MNNGSLEFTLLIFFKLFMITQLIKTNILLLEIIKQDILWIIKSKS